MQGAGSDGDGPRLRSLVNGSMRFVIASLFLFCATQGTASVSSRIDSILAL